MGKSESRNASKPPSGEEQSKDRREGRDAVMLAGTGEEWRMSGSLRITLVGVQFM